MFVLDYIGAYLAIGFVLYLLILSLIRPDRECWLPLLLIVTFFWPLLALARPR